jgi:hypothetical protein
VISFACGITAPLAIWLGYRSLRRIARSDGRLKGRGAAAGAVVMGAASAAFAVGGIAYWWLAS